MTQGYIKAKDWNGKDLKGTWEVTLKIDGVRALYNPGFSAKCVPGWYSRAGKPLFNIPAPPPGITDVEVYIHDRAPDQKQCFKDSIRATRTPTPKTTNGCSIKKCKCKPEGNINCPKFEWATPIIRPEHLYSLDPLDVRLAWGAMFPDDGRRERKTPTNWTDPTAGKITEGMELANKAGYEGLVLRQGDKWLKVKPKPSWDVLILDAIEGVGKRKGHVGAFMTSKGKVGGFRGFTYDDLRDIWQQHLDHPHGQESGVVGVLAGPIIGQTIEVEAMGLTPAGKFRQPRCIRFRPDKIAEE